MNWTDSKKLREDLYKVKEDMQRMVTETEKSNRDMTGEEDEKFRCLHEEGEKLQKRIERAEAVEKFTVDKLDKTDRRIGRSDSAPAEVRSALQDQDLRKAFVRGICKNDMSEYRALSSTTSTAGGEYIPETLVRDIEKEQLDYSGVLQIARVYNTPTGEPMKWPLFSDVDNLATIKEESATVDADVSPSTGEVDLNVVLLHSGIVPVPVQFLQDAVMTEQFLIEELGKRLGRKANRLYTNGNGGSDVMTGIITSAPKVEAAAIDYDTLVDFKLSVGSIYRRDAKWMISTEALKDLKKVVDDSGRLVWQPNLSVGAPTQIDGQDYVMNDDMPNDKGIAYGDWSKFVIRNAAGVTFRRLNEYLANKLQIGFDCWVRTGCAYLYSSSLMGSNAPIKVLDIHGS